MLNAAVFSLMTLADSVLKPLTIKNQKALSFTLGLFCLCLLGFSACSSKTDSSQVLKFSGVSMGTTYSVLYFLPKQDGKTSHADELKPELLKAQLAQRLEEIEQNMSTYRKDSDLSKFNQSPVNEWQKLDEELFLVLRTAQDISNLSEGAFDISVGPLVNLWGFGPDFHAQKIPDDQAINEALKQVGIRYLKLDSEQGRALKEKALYLDLSAIAKGYAVDQMAELLKAKGINNFLVEIGGELRASGTKEGQAAWKVAVEKPELHPLSRSIEGVLELKDIAIASSGDYRNYFEHDGKIYSHTINPATGKPVEHNLASVTVLHSSCMYADALATAMMVLDSTKALELADREQLAVLLLVREGENFKHLASKAMQPFVQASNPL